MRTHTDQKYNKRWQKGGIAAEKTDNALVVVLLKTPIWFHARIAVNAYSGSAKCR
jgi:hypothetical protein